MSQPDPSDPLIGQTIGSYTVQRKLGEGGMGAVYELLHPGIGKRLALKLLHAEYAARPQIVQRFFDEARAVNVIGHPNIVDIIDFANLEDGRAYITMEFLEGESLAAYMHRTGAMPVHDVVSIVRSICSALAAAHESGIVHRDLKPENIHLVPHPDNPRYVKVLDFGIAKLSADLHADPSAATRSGVVMGTPTYMSPEQAMGRTKEIDHRTDIYAMGIILYEMLTGQVPFSGDSFGDLMLAHLQGEIPQVTASRPDLPAPWNQVVTRALAKEREHRYQSMAELQADLEAATGGRAASVSGAHTVAAPAGAVPSQPPAMPGAHSRGATGGGTMAYDQSAPGTQPPPQTYPPQHPSVPANDSVVPAGGSKKPVLFAVTGVLAAVAAVVFFLVMGGGSGDDSTTAAAAPPPDAAAVAQATPPDAAVAAQAPPDAMVVAKQEPPDAAPTEKPAKPDRPERPTTTVKPRGKGTIKVTAAPWAMVYVDGKRIGQTPQVIELSVGRHKVELKNPELGADYTKRVNVRRNRTTKVHKSWTGGY